MALPIWVFILASVIKSAVVLFVLLTAVAYTVWLERKVVGHMQNRWGPTRVGPFGLLQPAADGIKFLFKEDLTPPHVYKPLFLAAPLIAVIFALTSIAVIPFGNSFTIRGYSIPLQITDVNTGLLLITASLIPGDGHFRWLEVGAGAILLAGGVRHTFQNRLLMAGSYGMVLNDYLRSQSPEKVVGTLAALLKILATLAKTPAGSEVPTAPSPATEAATETTTETAQAVSTPGAGSPT